MLPPVFCPWPAPQYWLFSGNVPHLVYYSHFLALGVAILAAFFVLWAGRKKLPNQLLFLMLTAFSLWVFLDSIFWAANNSDVIMFVWSLQILFEPFVYLGALYLFYALIKGKAVSFWQKIIFLIPYIPVIIAVLTRLALPGFDLSTCLSVEGLISIYYIYPLELLYTIILGILAFREYRATVEPKKKKEIIWLAVGTIFFLLAFSWGNIVSSFTENWNFAQIGLFAMPVFIAFLVYSIIRFRTFNIHVAIGRLVVYGLYLATALAIGLLIAFLNSQLTQPLPFMAIAPFIAVASVAICQLLGYYRKVAQYFYPTFRNTEITIAQLEEKLTEVLETDTMAALVTTTLKQAFQLQKLAVLVKNLQGPLLVRNNIGFSRLTLDSFAKAIEPSMIPILQKIKKPFGAEEVIALSNRVKPFQIADLQQFSQLLQINQINAVVPLWFRKRLVGLIVLGEKASQDPFTTEDLQLLAALSYQASIAMHNANLYSEVKKRKEELERFYRLTVGREMKMIELKKKNLELEEKLRENKN